MPQPLVWQRRQEMPPQWITTRPALVEGVERMDAVMICSQQRVGGTQRSPYAMNVDRRENRNYYSCEGFGHLARNCRNKRTGNRIGERRRLEYRRQRREKEGKEQSNLNREGD